MTDESFFEESSEQSQIKARIVAKYFWAWAKVVIPSAKSHGNRIAYIDLFAGPGRFKDGTVSTPMLVLEKALGDADMRKMLVTVFNDKDKDNAKSLTQVINALPGIEQLHHKPQIQSEEVGTEIVKMFEKMRLVPMLFFVDPWGYKGCPWHSLTQCSKIGAAIAYSFSTTIASIWGLTTPPFAST